MFGYAFIYTNSKLKKAFISCDRKAKKKNKGWNIRDNV